MPVTIVLGGQFGGEGKGAVAAYLASADKSEILVKTGGPNSGHWFGTGRSLFRVHMLPSGSNLGPTTLVFPPGCLIHPQTLLAEIEELKFRGRVLIDGRAGVIADDHIQEQRGDPFYDYGGSTKTGSGAALALRVKRRLPLARETPSLKPFLADTTAFLNQRIEGAARISIEGGQGFGLSNFHGTYPFVTSRDTTVGSLLSQVGLGPRYVDTIVQVIKCFPTRERIGQGPLPHEFDPTSDPELVEIFAERGGHDIVDLAASKIRKGDELRRVALFDFDLLKRSVIANTPDYLAVTGLDRLELALRHPLIKEHYGSVDKFLERLSITARVPIALQSWGRYIEDMRDLRRDARGGDRHALV